MYWFGWWIKKLIIRALVHTSLEFHNLIWISMALEEWELVLTMSHSGSSKRKEHIWLMTKYWLVLSHVKVYSHMDCHENDFWTISCQIFKQKYFVILAGIYLLNYFIYFLGGGGRGVERKDSVLCFGKCFKQIYMFEWYIFYSCNDLLLVCFKRKSFWRTIVASNISVLIDLHVHWIPCQPK